MKTYLLQRGNFEDRDYKKGIDSIVSFQYMGSSEFEWGALPESLSRIRDMIDQYIYMPVPMGDKTIMVFCKKDRVDEIKPYLISLANNDMHLKEYSDFNSYIKPSKYDNCRTNFWWDLENHLMFWVKDDKFTKKFKSVINPIIEKPKNKIDNILNLFNKNGKRKKG